MAVWSEVMLSELGQGFRLDAEHYRPEYLTMEELTRHGQPIQELLETIIHPVELTREYEDDGLPVVLAQDIRPSGLNVASPSFMPSGVRAQIARSRLVAGDVLMTRSGANFGDVAAFIDLPSGRGEYYACADCLILRPKAVTVGYLTAFLGSRVGRSLLSRGGYGAGQPHIAPPYIWQLKLPRFGAAEDDIDAQVRTAWRKREAAHSALNAAEKRLTESLGLDALDLTPQKCYSRPFRDLAAEGRFDAEYFSPKYQRVMERLKAGGRTLADVAPLATRLYKPDGEPIRYIEIGSLTGDGEAEAEAVDAADVPSRAKWVVQSGDVVTSTVRPVRRLSAVVRDDQAGCVCSSGFAVLTPKAGADGIEAEVLLTYLRLPLVCELLDLHTTATMYPAIPVERLMRFPVAVPDAAARAEILAKVRQAQNARREASRLLAEAKRAVEEFIRVGG